MAQRRATYEVDLGMLYDALSFHMVGEIAEAVDAAGGRYEVTIAGRGAGIAGRLESRGVLREGRWAPVRGRSWFDVAGRESMSEVGYDYGVGAVEYHSCGETFFLRRRRVADDLLPIPEGMHVDDAISATLNYSDRRWPVGADGEFLTHVVRRKRPHGERPDQVDGPYRAELVPFLLRVARDAVTGSATALVDLSRFSSWARPDRPARVVFDADRRPQLISSSFMLGTSVTIRLRRSS